MRKEKKYIYQYVIDDPNEKQLLKLCLDYCWHRATKHITPVSGIAEKINRLRKQLQ